MSCRSAATVFSTALLLAVSTAPAAVMTQVAPNHVAAANYVYLDKMFTNNDAGATYDSFEDNTLRDLAVQLKSLAQNASYPTIDALMADWSFGITNDGEVYNGWITSGYDPVTMSHGPFGFHQWTAGLKMATVVAIPLSQLDGDGDGWSASDPADFSIALAPTPLAAMAVGYEGFGGYPATGYPYVLTPEPGTLALLGVGALGFSRRRRGSMPTSA